MACAEVEGEVGAEISYYRHNFSMNELVDAMQDSMSPSTMRARNVRASRTKITTQEHRRKKLPITSMWTFIVVITCLASIIVRRIRISHFNFCSKTWTGSIAASRAPGCGYHVVVSHCSHDLGWIEDALRPVACVLKSFTVYSKCGIQVSDIPEIATVVQLENVGRCDHTYAHHLATRWSIDANREDLILFMKDTTEVHQPAQQVPYQDIIKVALGPYKFACGLRPFAGAQSRFRGLSIWHNVSLLSQFNLQRHTHDAYKSSSDRHDFHAGINKGEWLQNSLGVNLDTDIIPVCYGGVFATKISQILTYSPAFWSNVEQKLSRGDNIEEGHFMERTWAHMFLQPTLSQHKKIIARSLGNIEREHNGLLGTLYGCSCT